MANIFQTSKVEQNSGRALVLDDGENKYFCIYRPGESDKIKLIFCAQPEELQAIEFFNEPVDELISHLNTYGFTIEGVFDDKSFFDDTDYSCVPDKWDVSLLDVVVEKYSTLKLM